MKTCICQKQEIGIKESEHKYVKEYIFLKFAIFYFNFMISQVIHPG